MLFRIKLPCKSLYLNKLQIGLRTSCSIQNINRIYSQKSFCLPTKCKIVLYDDFATSSLISNSFFCLREKKSFGALLRSIKISLSIFFLNFCFCNLCSLFSSPNSRKLSFYGSSEHAVIISPISWETI